MSMNIPLEIRFKGIGKTKEINNLIEEKAGKLERICNYISSCRVAVEKPQRHQRSGTPYRVRIDITVPPGHELVARREPSHGDVHQELAAEIREAFEAAERQLKELVDRQRGETKAHPHHQVSGIVNKLFKEDGYGFLRTLDGREIYFHRNSLLDSDFDQLTIGTGVNYTEHMGEKGPQASAVRVSGKPGQEKS
jgi:cold shock CspA family protein/ribosome-associated translation inhibitor RaiA